MYHLLTAAADTGAFPMRARTSRATSGDAARDGVDDPSVVVPVACSTPTDPRPSLSVPAGPNRAALWLRPILCCGVFSIALVFGAAVVEPAHSQSITRGSSRADKIANALTAAPEEIARNATVKDWPTKGGEGLGLLRQGTNGWVCLPDDATTPGNDPTCLDETFHDALVAYFSGQTPKISRVGYAYMLTSDAEGSNTDPKAPHATPTNQWHHAGPHVMLLYPDPKLLDGLPTKPSAFGPYVMFPGTPIAHVMLPVQSGYARSGPPNANQTGNKQR